MPLALLMLMWSVFQLLERCRELHERLFVGVPSPVPVVLALYAVLLLMAFLLSRRFSRRLFKKAAMATFREEA